MPNLIHGQDPGGTLKPIQVDDNGNLSVDLVSGVNVSVTVDSTNALMVNQVSGSSWSTEVKNSSLETKQVSGSADSVSVIDSSLLVNQVSGASFSTSATLANSFYQIRTSVTTANIALANGTETTLLAGIIGVNLDCMQIVCANQSDAVVDIDFRSVTAGGVDFSLTIPADNTAGFIPTVPWPQASPGNTWTADMADITGTTVNISALFIKN